jgi:integrase
MSDETAITIYTGNEQTPSSYVDTSPYDVLPSLEQVIKDWLNTSKSDSEKTRKARRDTFLDFCTGLAGERLRLDGPAGAISSFAQRWAAESRREGVRVAPSTYNQRVALISSFYGYAIAHEAMPGPNPLAKELVERKAVGAKDAARPLPKEQVSAGLASIDRSTVEGLRDYALLSIALFTGRRAGELAAMRYGDLQRIGEKCAVDWPRCKGNKAMRDVLSPKTTKALYAYLTHEQVYGNRLLTLDKKAPLWLSFSTRGDVKAIGPRTISRMCERYLGTSKVHATRHSAALQWFKLGLSLQEISKRLGHSSIAITSDYLEDLLEDENPVGMQLEEAFGI